MVDDVNCSLCVELLGVTDTLQCYGFCGKSFHLSCLMKTNNNYKKSLIDSLQKLPNLHWYCDICHALSMNGISRAFSECASTLIQIKHILAPTRSTDPTVNNLHTNDVDMHSTDSGSSHTQAHNRLSSLVVSPSPSQPSPSSGKNKRKIVHSPVITRSKVQRMAPSAAPPNPQSQAAPLSQASNLSNLTNPPASAPPFSQIVNNESSTQPFGAHSKCLYITGFKPETEVADILQHLTIIGISNANELQCKKLVSDFRANKKLSFVSFKLFVPLSILPIIFNQTNWPDNVTVREFVDNSRKKQNFLQKEEGHRPLRNAQQKPMQTSVQKSATTPPQMQKMQFNQPPYQMPPVQQHQQSTPYHWPQMMQPMALHPFNYPQMMQHYYPMQMM